MGLNAHNHQ